MKKTIFDDIESWEGFQQTLLKIIFKSMMYVVREEGETVDEKYEKLDEQILTFEELSLTDMLDNLETIYEMIDKTFYEKMEDEEEEADE